ncbi:hypothetical protein B0H14DRAFT_2587379 [Mycena olivaceomarginata]|nr:hypothetical protein B0H14DRAFT_2587379 [Mycena olivaceomarginata]
MSGDEDEAGAVHDDAGEHSDGPGGMGEAGVVHAPMHNLGDILRAVHTAAKGGGDAEDMRGGVSNVARRHGGRDEGACTVGQTESGTVKDRTMASLRLVAHLGTDVDT